MSQVASHRICIHTFLAYILQAWDTLLGVTVCIPFVHSLVVCQGTLL